MPSLPDPRDAWTPEEAQRLLDECKRDGSTMAEFARRRGVSPARLYWWKKRLASEPSILTRLSLVPATVVSSSTATITIRLPNGIAIDVADGSPILVAEIVAELTRSMP